MKLTRSRNRLRIWCLAGTTLVIALSANVVALSAVGAAPSAPYFYLAIGASESLGFQPTPDEPRGEPTVDGYANDLLAYEAARGISLDLTQTGCPGETLTTMLSGNDHCYDGLDTQLATDMNFLSQHANEQGIVTIDLGFNDVRLCLRHRSDADGRCVQRQLELVRDDLTMIVESLKSVAGPGVTFIGLGHYDPYLADEILNGARGADFAAHSERVINRLNGELQYVYSSEGVPMADVDSYFDGKDRVPIAVAGLGTVPTNVAQICDLTWMCAPAPDGPNFHPDAEGYTIIAQAIEGALSAPW
ncbi:MAG: hypothetical protein WCA31_02440 [Acidimicrobiales bacterium]